MSLLTTNAIIIRSINYKDSSKILTLFSKELGRFTAIAHGSRRLANSNNASYLIGNLVRVVVYRKQDISIMGTISQIGIINQFSKIKNDLIKIGLSNYFLEFTYKNTEEGQVNYELYDLLLNSLEYINIHSVNKDWKFIWDFHALDTLGLKPQFNLCVFCNSVVKKGFWITKEGSISCGCNGEKGYPLLEEDILSFKKVEKKLEIKTEEITDNVKNVLNDMVNVYAYGPLKSLFYFSF